MAILAIMRGNHLTREQYDSLRPVAKWETERPAGLLLHTCATDPKGGLRVVDVWESKEQLESFFKTRLLPAMKTLKIEPPEMDVFPLYNCNAFEGIERYEQHGKPGKSASATH